MDKRVSRMLIGTEIDLKNLMAVLRCWGLDEDEVIKLLIDYSYNLDEGFLMGC